MKKLNYLSLLIIALFSISATQLFAQEKKVKLNKLTPDEERVIIHKGTEMPFTGKHTDNKTY